MPVISARGLYLSTSAHPDSGSCLIGLSPVELCVSDVSVVIAAGAQAGVNPVSSAAIIY